MAEKKRVNLLPFGCNNDSNHGKVAASKTIRIKVELPDPSEDTYPTFSYKVELAKAMKKFNIPGEGCGNSDDEDEDVRRIARQMEEKYGVSSGTGGGKKKNKLRKDDYADIGMGYDESDSFIDNTDGYDEMIPHNVTTLHGGFYINSGALEFKMVDEEANSDFSSSSSDSDNDDVDDGDEDEDNKEQKKSSLQLKVNRKRILDSSDETDRENKTDEQRQMKKLKLKNGTTESNAESLNNNGVHPQVKRKLLEEKHRNFVKKKKVKKVTDDVRKENESGANLLMETILVDKCEKKESGDNVESASNISSIIESVVKANVNKKKIMVDSAEESKNIAQVVVNLSSSSDSSPNNAAIPPATIEKVVDNVKLPEYLSPDIISIIKKIKNCALDNVKENKNVFNTEMNTLLLKLERNSKCLGKPSKLKVYANLATHLKCKPDALMKRAKDLVLEQERKELRLSVAKLHMAITNAMPELLENYDKESQRILMLRKTCQGGTEDNKTLRMPKRKFVWSDESRKLIKEVLTTKRRCLLQEGTPKDSIDAEMTIFIKNEVQTLWPEGWMSMNALNKIYVTYLAPKRAATTSEQQKSVTITPTTTTALSSQSFNNSSNLSITPIVSKSEVVVSSKNVGSFNNVNSVEKSEVSMNLSKKSLPPSTQSTDSNVKLVSDNKKRVENIVEGKLKVKPASELMKPSLNHNLTKIDQSLINLLNETDVMEAAKAMKSAKLLNNASKDNYCQVIDLSEPKSKSGSHVKLKETIISPVIPSSSHHKSELSITPTYSSAALTNKHHDALKSKSSCDEIQKVMEGLKVLQKMSSPKKCIESSTATTSSSPTSSAVSVIAVNKSFAPKSSSNGGPPVLQRYDCPKSETTSGFQDEFQKQLVSAAFSQMTSTATSSSGGSKNYHSVERYSHNSAGGQKDKYNFQNSNNNYSANGLKGNSNSGTTSQTGIYSILDDMYANFLSQYGYAKEAPTPKSEPK